jgi:integrase/recombinase XerD
MANNLYRRGKVWWGRVQVSGNDIRKSLGTQKRDVAMKRLTDWLAKLNEATHDGRPRALWQEAVLHYVKIIMPENVKLNTGKRYLVSFRQVSAFLSDKYIDEIDEATIADLVEKRKLDEAKNATIRRDLTAISNVFRAAKPKKWCRHNAVEDYGFDQIKEKREPLVLPTDEEVAAAIANVPPMMGHMMRLADRSGMRENEIVTLERDQRTTNFYSIAQIKLTKTKTNRPRVIPLAGPILEDADAVLSKVPQHLHSKLYFWHGDGLPYRNFASNYAYQKQVHGFKFRFHDLRHKFAVDYLRRGGNIYDLQQILGHSSIKTTELYLAHLDPMERRIAEDGPGLLVARSS